MYAYPTREIKVSGLLRSKYDLRPVEVRVRAATHVEARHRVLEQYPNLIAVECEDVAPALAKDMPDCDAQARRWLSKVGAWVAVVVTCAAIGTLAAKSHPDNRAGHRPNIEGSAR